MTLYLKEVELNPEIKRYTCYLRAEALMVEQTGTRQYIKYDTFKASMSRRQKVRRLNARGIKNALVNHLVN